jgi:hypothetical protein
MSIEKIVRISFEILFSVIFLTQLNFILPELIAQTTEPCDTILAKAEEQYTLGNWNNAIELIQQCLQKIAASDADKEKSYRLLGLVYIATEFEKDAKEAIKNLLILAPNYQINPDEDPPQFQKIISDISLSLIPKIDNVIPNMSQQNEPGIKIKVTGSNFAYGSIVQFDGNERLTEYLNSGELDADLTAEDLMNGGEHDISIYSPILGGKQSNLVKFIVDTSITFSNLYLTISGVFSLPVGDFGEANGKSGDGYATFGFGALGEVNLVVLPPDWGWLTSIAFFYNGYNDKQVSSIYYDDLINGYVGSVSYNLNNDVIGYLIIPIMTGLSYKTQLSADLELVGFGQGIFSLVKGPEISSDLSGASISGTAKVSYDFAYAFGIGAGAGLIINDFMNASVRFLYLGNLELNYSVELNLDNYNIPSASYKVDQLISVIVFSVGVVF